MPPRAALSSIPTRAAASEAYVCPSCLLRGSDTFGSRAVQQRRLHQQLSRKLLHSSSTTIGSQFGATTPRKAAKTHGVPRQSIRTASNGTLASTTAINPPSTVPAAYKDIHQKLNALQDAAGGHIDLSRLQLALRSLENGDPVIRVALLGLGSNGAMAAKKLARVLLSDALGDEEAWERKLLEARDDGRSILLKYGDPEDIAPESPIVRTLLVPSPLLRRHGLEIMITSFNSGATSVLNETKDLVDAMLVPSLTIANAGGRVGFVRYPVHKALMVAEGIRGAVEYGRLPLQGADSAMIDAALSLPLRTGTGSASSEESITGNSIDIDLAGHALEIFRADKANGAKYSHEWETSRIPVITQWLAASNTTTSSGLKAAVINHINSTLEYTQRSIDQARDEQETVAKLTTISETKRNELQAAVSDWSAEAHKDLQLNLTGAFASPSWKRTAWFRLLWRIDDVSYSAADILRRSWLHEAEQSIAFLSGRVQESGLATAEQLKESGTEQKLLDEGMQQEMRVYEQVKDQTESVAELMQMPTMLSRLQQQYGVNALFDPPWPQTINLARQQMLHVTVPALHRKAQVLLISTLTTMGGTAALGGWLWVATAGTALAEAGAVAALGLVWSLRRLQKYWGKERDTFAITMQEDGRRVLAEVEGHLRKVVGEGGTATVRPEDLKAWDNANSAVVSCQEALKKAQ